MAQRAAPVFMYQLAYQNPTLVPGTDFPLGSPHASDINLKFANTDKNLDFFLYADQSPGRLATARHMSALWAGFARNGRPTATRRADMARLHAEEPGHDVARRRVQDRQRSGPGRTTVLDQPRLRTRQRLKARIDAASSHEPERRRLTRRRAERRGTEADDRRGPGGRRDSGRGPPVHRGR